MNIILYRLQRLYILCKAWITINKQVFPYLLNLNMNNKLLICNQLAFVCFFRFLFVSLENDTPRVWPISRGCLLLPGTLSYLLYIQGSVYAMHSFLNSYFFFISRLIKVCYFCLFIHHHRSERLHILIITHNSLSNEGSSVFQTYLTVAHEIHLLSSLMTRDVLLLPNIKHWSCKTCFKITTYVCCEWG